MRRDNFFLVCTPKSKEIKGERDIFNPKDCYSSRMNALCIS